MADEGQLLWHPSAELIKSARITAFAESVGVNGDYAELLAWSLEDIGRFWSELAKWFGVRWSNSPSAALADRSMPSAQWFPGGTLNYAEHALDPPVEIAVDEPAVIFLREDGLERLLSWSQLRAEVASVRTALGALGVKAGDRVVGLLPNAPEALIAMLASVSIGAIWSSCSPDFGLRATADRFAQIEPVVLFAVDGYRYGGRSFDIRENVAQLMEALPHLHATVLVPYLDPDANLPGTRRWSDLVTATQAERLDFEPMPFDAPMWILYSSGTTGLPKPIVHGHGGILLEHVKQLALHLDLGPGDRFFWFSTTGWMMWNLLVSGLVVGATVVLFDGNPTYPTTDALWRMAESKHISTFGVSAPFLHTCQKQGITPHELDLSALRTIGSTGAPLSPDGFCWVYEAVKNDVLLMSLSGGTDVCTALIGGAPTLPVRAGIIACRMLGCAVHAYDPDGRSIVDEMGELVVTEPMPSMPVELWGDPTGHRLRETYYGAFPGVWQHGDWITMKPDGSCVLHGRSDSTLNRGGVRMGTAEFYRVVEEIPGIEDSLIIDTSGADVEGRLLLFIVAEHDLDFDRLCMEIRTSIRKELSPRHVPDEIVRVAEVPRTLNGKKCEVPVKRLLAGIPLRDAISPDALSNPRALIPFVSAR